MATTTTPTSPPSESPGLAGAPAPRHPFLWLLGVLGVPLKVIGRRGDPYLYRWTFFDLGFCSLKLHKIVRDDYDDLHDHPWDFWSLILAGGYYEERMNSPPHVDSHGPVGAGYSVTRQNPGT